MNKLFHTTITKEELTKFAFDRLEPFLPFFIAVSGAHIYGFASDDSDIDLRGSFLFDKDSILGFRGNKSQTINNSTLKINNVELDFVAHELRKFTMMVSQGENGYVMEQVFSPILIYQSEEFSEFLEGSRKFFITKKLYKHYNGFAINKREKFKEESEKRIKTLLYAFRVLYTGIHLFNTGEIVTNLKELNQQLYQLPYIDDLIEQKKVEKSLLTIDTEQSKFYEDEINRLLTLLEESYLKSSLPENVRNSYKLNRIVSGIYSKQVLKHEFNIPVMRSTADQEFIDKSKEKLLLKCSPFAKVEQELGIKLSPKKIVFLPHFINYFLLKKELPRGKFYEFLDLERFLIQLKKSNPFCLLALYGNNKDVYNEFLNDLETHKDRIITRQIYKTFKGVTQSIFDSINTEEEFGYRPKKIILMLSLLIHGSFALKYGCFEADLTPYFQMFKAIQNKEIPLEKILDSYDELTASFEDAYNKTILINQKPDEEIFETIVRNVKLKLWLEQ